MYTIRTSSTQPYLHALKSRPIMKFQRSEVHRWKWCLVTYDTHNTSNIKREKTVRPTQQSIEIKPAGVVEITREKKSASRSWTLRRRYCLWKIMWQIGTILILWVRRKTQHTWRQDNIADNFVFSWLWHSKWNLSVSQHQCSRRKPNFGRRKIIPEKRSGRHYVQIAGAIHCRNCRREAFGWGQRVQISNSEFSVGWKVVAGGDPDVSKKGRFRGMCFEHRHRIDRRPPERSHCTRRILVSCWTSPNRE